MKTAVLIKNLIYKEQSTQLANQLNLPLTDSIIDDYLFYLFFEEHTLKLHANLKPKINPIYVDFLSGEYAHRRQYGGGRGQLIAKACGFSKNKELNILDTTAGLGGDAFVLASLGANMTLIERSPIIAALLQDGLARAQNDTVFGNINMQLIHQDAIQFLNTTNQRFDAIYLDPMYPESKKTAEAKKEMRILRMLVGKDEDAKKLLSTACQHARKRVVVKRPRHAPCLSELKPDVVYDGKSSRFDVYTRHT